MRPGGNPKSSQWTLAASMPRLILEARRILLLASGSSKATSIAQAIEGPVTASVTASALQHHPDVTFIVDQEAGANLKHHDYYARVLRLTAELTPERI